jgi:subtilisin family serine protease
MDNFREWVKSHAEVIAAAARHELGLISLSALGVLPSDLQRRTTHGRAPSEESPVLVHRVFLDREATLSDTTANCTIKADAAVRVFDISCRTITWAIIDSGINAEHPAFTDWDARSSEDRRVRATYDFTRIERIRNFDLTLDPEGSTERRAAIEDVVAELEFLPGRRVSPEFRQTAVRNLEEITRQLDRRLPPDWALIEPLIRWNDEDGSNGKYLVSDHGTHVAGILASDWRRSTTRLNGSHEGNLTGICPDLNLYDLRVIHPSRPCTESAIISSLDFVHFLNTWAAGQTPVIHGINISLSIPHDVRLLSALPATAW